MRVIGINGEAMRRAGLPQYTSKEIIELTKNDPATWDILAKGWTQGINQCQGAGTTEKLMTYKPRSLQDLSAFVAAIRPGFKSMAPKFLHREKFEYGIPSFDALLKNDTTGSSWLLYQEDIMKCLALAEFLMEETMPIIKAISKKKAKVIDAAKVRFIENFKHHIIDVEGASEEEAVDIADKVWRIILDSSRYSFNASHAVAVAIDAIYGAYLKAHYPFEYYSTLLDNYANQGNKDKVALIKGEMKKAFGITVAPCRFRQDNRSFYIDKQKRQVADALHSVKHIGKSVPKELYKLRNTRFDTFIDLLCVLDDIKAINSKAIKILIRMGYFDEFGSKGKLLKLFWEFSEGKNKITKQLKDATREKRLVWLKNFEVECEESDVSPEEQIAFEAEHYGTPITVYPEARGKYLVIELETKYSPKAVCYSIGTGNTGVFKILKKDFNSMPFKAGDVITVLHSKEKLASSYIDGKRVPKKGVYENWVDLYEVTSIKKEEPSDG